MDYFATFDISATGLQAEKLRLDTIANNLANAQSTRGNDGGPYKSLRVITAPRFESVLSGQAGATTTSPSPAGVQVLEVRPVETDPKRVYDPAHPDAKADGYVEYPNINPVSEMVDMIQALRAYEANVQAVNAAKKMAAAALEIGSKK
jgi:flagellar basal-body rod protein FlgC